MVGVCIWYKGASVIRMMNYFLGNEIFEAGITVNITLIHNLMIIYNINYITRLLRLCSSKIFTVELILIFESLLQLN